MPVRVSKKTATATAAAKAVSVADQGVLTILDRIRTTKKLTEVRHLSTQLERLIFHKQYSNS